MKELFLIVADICDSGNYLNLDQQYSEMLYIAFGEARKTELGKQWEKEESVVSHLLSQL